MYSATKLGLLDIAGLRKVEAILYRCGKNMAQEYGLQHWNNSHLKNAVIVFLCALKNDIYLVCDEKRAVATFQTDIKGQVLKLQKLATDPVYAGKGAGTFCMQTLEEIAKEMSCKKICLEVYDQSRHAVRFYEKRGYTLCGTTSSLKYTELQMEKCIGEQI